MNKPQYDLFLSYNSADRAEVSQFLAKLRELPEPINTFIDRETLNLGKSWFEEIQEAVTNSRAIAVFYGKNGLGRWQNKEMILAMDQQATANPDDSHTLYPGHSGVASGRRSGKRAALFITEYLSRSALA